MRDIICSGIYYGIIMKTWELFWMGIIVMITFLASYSSAEEVSSEPLINGTGIYLSPGEKWTFYQGYSLTLKSLSETGDRSWVDLKLNEDLVKSEVLSEDQVFYYNITAYSNEIIIFSIKVSGIYIGEDYDMVTFSPVYQYYDPTKPKPTPTENPQVNKNNSNESNTVPAGSEIIPGFQVLLTAIIISLYGILIRCLSR